jgi:hypothetical protein
MVLIAAGLGEGEADVLLDRLADEFAGGRPEDVEALLRFVGRLLAEVRKEQTKTPGRAETVITGVIAGLAAMGLHEFLKSEAVGLKPVAVQPSEARARQIFVDMDGVLSDFDTGYDKWIRPRSPCEKRNHAADWAAVRRVPNFFFNLPPMSDMQQVWAYIARYRPVVLTGFPSAVPEAPGQKRAWASRYLSPQIEVCCCRAEDKCHYASLGDILIDDYERYRDRWIDKGGLWVTHRSAAETIYELRRLGID